MTLLVRRLVATAVAIIVAAIPLRRLWSQVSVLAYGPESVAACEAAEVTVAATIPGKHAPRIGLPSFAPFELIRTSQSARTSVDGEGRTVTFVEGRFVLTTDRIGTFTIPPFTLRTTSGVARSRALRIRVMPSRGSVPSVVARAPIDTSLDVNFRAIALPETVYVGQQATYEVAVFLGDQVRERMRRNPTFFPPEMQSMLAYELPTLRGEPPRRRVGARCFDALVYQRAIFPLLAGRFVIPPAQLSYALAANASIFSREESREARTDSVILVALEPPLDGRPADFTGAVGAFAVRSRIDTVQVRVGDPLRLTVRVEGTGNVKLLPRPSMSVPWASLVPADERVSVDSTAEYVRGAKEFDWVLTPRRAGELELAPLRYTYFDPVARRYATAHAPPLRVRVAPGSLAALTDSAATDAPLSLRPRYRGPAPPPVHERPVFWALIALVPIPALARRWRSRALARRARSAHAALAARRLHGDPPTDARALRRLFIDAIAERVHLSAETFTRGGALSRGLRRAGVSRATADDAETLLRELDAAAFSADGAPPSDSSARATAIVRRIDGEALTSSELGSFVGLAVVGGGLALASLAHAGITSPRVMFTQGVRAYEAGSPAQAQKLFAAVANRVQRSPDAWANLGTAAWSANDTAMAVIGWQRALRLEPTAADVRERLELAHPGDVRATGFVPPIPLTPLALLGALFWAAAWAIDAVARNRVSRGLRVGLAVLAAASALVGVDAHDRQRGRSLAVVFHPGSLATTPSLTADLGASAHRGEIARVLARDGAWTLVRLDGGREGWIAAASVVAVTGEPVPERAGPPASN